MDMMYNFKVLMLTCVHER